MTSLDEPIPHGAKLTYADYLTDLGYGHEVAVIRNVGYELSTPAAGWLALNPAFGTRLGWKLATEGLFRWLDAGGNIMVESIWWRDGWTDLEPPHSFVTLGEGWLLVCSKEAYEAVIGLMPPARIIIGMRRAVNVEDAEGHRERTDRTLFAERPF